MFAFTNFVAVLFNNNYWVVMFRWWFWRCTCECNHETKCSTVIHGTICEVVMVSLRTVWN